MKAAGSCLAIINIVSFLDYWELLLLFEQVITFFDTAPRLLLTFVLQNLNSGYDSTLLKRDEAVCNL